MIAQILRTAATLAAALLVGLFLFVAIVMADFYVFLPFLKWAAPR